ncbi:hypothetical protein Taro_007088 [Colocasia esculenta]|uniref:Uncharacterized protein n=1 Tax=Colocasia esculenta TaxID=4460 RepID=A0A843U2T1_COLES|nr:hypothetical protein [Colocasia esculenta]
MLCKRPTEAQTPRCERKFWHAPQRKYKASEAEASVNKGILPTLTIHLSLPVSRGGVETENSREIAFHAGDEDTESGCVESRLGFVEYGGKAEVKVGNERTTNLGTDVLKLRENATKCKKVKKSQQISGAKIFTNEFVDVDINEVLQKNNPVGIENNWTMPTKWSIEAKNGLKGTPAEEENLRTQCTSFSREDHTSVSADLAPGIFYKHRTGKFLRMSDCKFNSEDVSSDLCKVPRVHMDTDSSQRICTLDHIKHDPHERTHLEKDMLRQSLDHVACLTSLHLLKREDNPELQVTNLQIMVPRGREEAVKV